MGKEHAKEHGTWDRNWDRIGGYRVYSVEAGRITVIVPFKSKSNSSRL